MNSFIGFMCIDCGVAINVGVSAGSGKPTCPNCSKPMVPNPSAIVMASVTCDKCGTHVGMLSGGDKCSCGGTFK